jgi:hypothetical protein
VAIRTTEALVKAVLQRDYDLRNTPSLTRYIASASMITDAWVTCATNKGYTVSDELATEMETWLSAYRYTHNLPVYTSKSTDGRSASFLREQNMNPYKLGALELDPSGCLAFLLDTKAKQKVGFSHLGKRPSEAIPYPDRD